MRLTGLTRALKVEAVPRSTGIIPSKWVFDAKTDGNNEVTRFKARLVIQGFRQREGIDCTEVFSPTIRHEQVRLLLATAPKRLGRVAGELGLNRASVERYLQKR